MSDSVLEIIITSEREGSSGPRGGYADSISILMDGTDEAVLNGGFENWTDGSPDSWSPDSAVSEETTIVQSGSKSLRNWALGGAYGRTVQQVTIPDPGIPLSCVMSCQIRSYTDRSGRDVGARVAVYVRHTRTGRYLDSGGNWSTDSIAFAVSDIDPSVWVSVSATFNPMFGPSYPPPPPEDPPEPPIVEDPAAAGAQAAILAISGLAVAGLSRIGFYPNQTDDMVIPPADPPVYDGGIYAYHDETDGKE